MVYIDIENNYGYNIIIIVITRRLTVYDVKRPLPVDHGCCGQLQAINLYVATYLSCRLDNSQADR